MSTLSNALICGEFCVKQQFTKQHMERPSRRGLSCTNSLSLSSIMGLLETYSYQKLAVLFFGFWQRSIYVELLNYCLLYTYTCRCRWQIVSIVTVLEAWSYRWCFSYHYTAARRAAAGALRCTHNDSEATASALTSWSCSSLGSGSLFIWILKDLKNLVQFGLNPSDGFLRDKRNLDLMRLIRIWHEWIWWFHYPKHSASQYNLTITLVDSRFVGGAKKKARRQSLRRNLVDDSENPVHLSVKFFVRTRNI
jgi:hypothetical protein